jgi:hypothetical protein
VIAVWRAKEAQFTTRDGFSLNVKKKKTPTVGPYGAVVNLVVDMGHKKAWVSRVESRYRFAFELRNAARVMANKARAVADKDGFELRAFVMAAVTLAWSSLDAALNEFILLNATQQRETPLSEVEKAVIDAIGSEDLRPRKSQHTLQLFNMMLRLLKKSQLAENEQPNQSANLVRHLRNMLVHPKPGQVVTFSENPNENLSEQQQIVKQLRSHLHLDRSATFPRDILNSNCADWAVSSCESFLQEFVKRSGVSPGFVTKV